MRAVRVIDDLETLKVLADPTRAAILELLAETRSVTQLAAALEVPRTRLYHHIELLQSKGLIEQVAERRVGALTERLYALTAKVFRPSARLLRSGDAHGRVEAITTLLFDTTKSDLGRSVASGELELDERGGVRRAGLGRSIAHLSPEQAAEFISELEALVARFDDAHASAEDARPFAFVWALYPSSRRIG
jgi:DNA-binding transcriptional ArsR family regulator